MNLEHELPQKLIEEIAGTPPKGNLTNRQRLILSAWDIRIGSLTAKIDNYKRGSTWKQRWETTSREEMEQRNIEIGWTGREPKDPIDRSRME